MSNERRVIAAKLKEAREYLGLSQQEVADAMNLSRSAISLIESSQRRVDSLELERLAKLYQRPINHFTSDEDLASSDILMLARQMKTLSNEDRNELLRFSEFLRHRAKAGSES